MKQVNPMKPFAALLLLALLVAPAFAQVRGSVSGALEAYRLGDAIAALNQLHPLSDGGDPEAQYTLAMVLEFGLLQDEEAAGWYRKAAQTGHAAAANNLGAMHYEGRGVPRDRVRARELYRSGGRERLRSGAIQPGAAVRPGPGWPAALVPASISDA
jgi:hypothetical protein